MIFDIRGHLCSNSTKSWPNLAQSLVPWIIVFLFWYLQFIIINNSEPSKQKEYFFPRLIKRTEQKVAIEMQRIFEFLFYFIGRSITLQRMFFKIYFMRNVNKKIITIRYSRKFFYFIELFNVIIDNFLLHDQGHSTKFCPNFSPVSNPMNNCFSCFDIPNSL